MRTGVVASAFGFLFLVGISLSSLGPLLPQFQERLGADLTEAYVLIPAFFGGSLLAMLALSTGRVSGKRTNLVALGVYSLSSGGLFLSTLLPVSVLCALLAGLSSSLVGMNINIAFARRPNGVALVNLVNGMFALGTIAGPLIASLSLSLGMPWGYLVVAVGALACVRVHRIADLSAEPSTHDDRPPVPHRVTIGFMALYVCFGTVETSIGSWAATHLASTGATAQEAARAVALFWGATAVSKFATLALARRFPASTLVIAAFVGGTGSLVVAALPHAAVLGYVLVGLAIGLVFPTGLAWIAQVGGGTRLTGFAAGSSMVGSVVFPAAIGWLVTSGQPGAIPLAIAVFAAGGAGAATWTRRLVRA